MYPICPAERKQLAHALSGNGLAFAQARVIWGEPREALASLVGRWAPDLVVCDKGTARALGTARATRTEVMTIPGRGVFGRIAEFFFTPAQGRA